MTDADILIIGSGMGGATMAAALAPSGRDITILERGDYLQATSATRSDIEIFAKGSFRTPESWIDGEGKAFNPGNFYYVGGNSKLYGAVLIRYRRQDFTPRKHIGGWTEAWPISYELLEPYYQNAENLYKVRGDKSQDPTEPFHSGDYEFPPVQDEPSIQALRKRFSEIGLMPASLPLGVDIEKWLSFGKQPWDGFPNANYGKFDAESIGIDQALRHKNVKLITNALVTKLDTDKNQHITSVHFSHAGKAEIIRPKLVILAAGAVNTAVLLLNSANELNPNGLANRSDQVGRNFMNHNTSAVLAIHPWLKNPAIYQKTIMVNDYYSKGGPHGEPLGNIQMLGKISANILSSQSKLPKFISNWIADRSFDLYAMSEDLPNTESRVTLKQGQIHLDWKRSNMEAHLNLVKKLKLHLRQMGFPIVLSKPFDRKTPSHQCGTARMGLDAKSSVVDENLCAHDHPNLMIVDASVLPSSAAVNPALTIAALALRAAEFIQTHKIYSNT